MRIIICPCGYVQFNIQSGGITCCFDFARILSSYNINVEICAYLFNPNPLFNKAYNGEPFDIEDTIVIYGEGVSGNPLNAKYIVRWMLAPSRDINTTNTWNDTDLIYFFNSRPCFNSDNTLIYKLLSNIYIPEIARINPNIRIIKDSWCHTIRKGPLIHKSNIKFIHPENSIEIDHYNYESKMTLFNQCNYFMCYDPLCFYVIIAAMCGCTAIVYPVEGMSKSEWISTQSIEPYLKSKGYDNLFGVAYGLEDISYAEKTKYLVREQWIDYQEYCIKLTVEPFLKDMHNYINNDGLLQNTLLNTRSNIQQ